MKKNGAMIVLMNDEMKRNVDDLVWYLVVVLLLTTSHNTMPDSGAFVNAKHTPCGVVESFVFSVLCRIFL
jgi:hypothetical protein